MIGEEIQCNCLFISTKCLVIYVLMNAYKTDKRTNSMKSLVRFSKLSHNNCLKTDERLFWYLNTILRDLFLAYQFHQQRNPCHFSQCPNLR